MLRTDLYHNASMRYQYLILTFSKITILEILNKTTSGKIIFRAELASEGSQVRRLIMVNQSNYCFHIEDPDRV